MGAFTWKETKERLQRFVNWGWFLVFVLILAGLVMITYGYSSLYYYQKALFEKKQSPIFSTSRWFQP